MAKERYPHIFLKNIPRIDKYQSRGFNRPKIPKRDRISHGERLKGIFKEIWDEITNNNLKRDVVSLPVKDGIYLEFKGKEAYDLITESLEDVRAGIKLLNIRQEGIDNKQTTIATVYIPERKRDHFLKKIDAYIEEDTKKGKPKNKLLVESIENIRLAVLESFWQDAKNLFPGEKNEWIEMWLSHTDIQKVEVFTALLETLKINYNKDEKIFFPERTVLIISANRVQLTELLQRTSDIAEMRLAKETAFSWMELSNKDQSDWVIELKKRLIIKNDSEVTVCILDTGINRGHDLIKPLLNEKHMDSWNKQWGNTDHHGHGTGMAGIIIYGNIEEALQSKNSIAINHIIESVKILPPRGENPKHLYGAITTQSISKAEINAPHKIRIICLAITTNDSRDNGKPSSWSGAVDALASGSEDGQKRLIILAAGNASTEQSQTISYKYPDSNLTDSIHDPAQAWNAVTVGAFTEKTKITDPDLSDYKSLAEKGCLSPFSTTSLTWERKWPIKPDILMEGGNLGVNSNNEITECDDLSILTTYYKPTIRQFDIFNQTSSAAAKAAWFAAQIANRYPHAWPETIRALLIHSANWTNQMKEQFLSRPSKKAYARFLKIYGYGVPSLPRAIECLQNSLTLIIEQVLQPFIKEKGGYKTNDMHIHKLPWPDKELLNLGAIEVQLKVTLSYFIEPGPGEIGWKDKYRYASHGLRFDVKKPFENLKTFTKRINKLAREEEDKEQKFPSDPNWILGTKNRKSGSIHSDTWLGTAAELSSCDTIAVYPVIGWWRERHQLKKWNKKARYSLVVSIYTPQIDIDIYTPVQTKIKIPVEIEV